MEVLFVASGNAFDDRLFAGAHVWIGFQLLLSPFAHLSPVNAVADFGLCPIRFIGNGIVNRAMVIRCVLTAGQAHHQDLLHPTFSA